MANPAASETRNVGSAAAGSPATPAAQHPADLTALTGRDDFLLELGEVLAGRASVHPADSLDAAVQHLGASRRGQLLVIDARGTGDVRTNVELAADRFPLAVILVFTEAHAEKEVAAAVKGTKVFAVLPIPMEPAKTAAVLEAALADAERAMPARHAEAPRPARSTAVPTLTDRAATPAASAPSAEQPPAGRGKLLWTGIGALALAVAVSAGWFMLHGSPAHAPVSVTARAAAPRAAQPQAAPLAQPAVDTSIVQGRVDDLLEKARRAMFERHFTTPKGDNALVYYRSVLAVDPSNGEAKDGLRRVGNVLVSRFNDAISHTQYPQAALALATLKLARPGDPHLAAFQQQLITGEFSEALSAGHLNRAAALVTQAGQWGVPAGQIAAWQAELSHQQHSQQIQGLAQQIEARIRANALEGASGAEADFATLRTLAPDSKATQRAGAALVAAILAQARNAAVAGQSADESRWVAEARANGASASQIADLQRQIANARSHAALTHLGQLVSLARARLKSGALTQPAQDSAVYYLTGLEAAHPTGAIASAAAKLRATLVKKLLARAESAARAGQTAQVQSDMAQARQWGASGSALSAAAAAASAAAQPTAADMAQIAASLRRTHYVSPAYPESALADRVSGEVTVQYVVDTHGKTRHVTVVAARPSGVFDRAALDAIRRWRYAPPEFHGKPVEVPIRTLIRFVLPN